MMGCAHSKVADLPLVLICRDRCVFLERAIHHRFALAQAQVDYVNSLSRLAASLYDFIEQHGLCDFQTPRNADISPDVKDETNRNSNAGSHLHFHSDSSDSDDDSTLHLHVDDHLSLHSNNVNLNHTKKAVIEPTVIYQQPELSPEAVHFGESSSNEIYSQQNNRYPSDISSTFPYSERFVNDRGYSGTNVHARSSLSRRTSLADLPPQNPPPPPPPPSGWDFLNPFENFEAFYPPYASKRDSKEVRRDEEIPDLEDQYEPEVVKEVHGGETYYTHDIGSSSRPEGVPAEDTDAEAALYRTRKSDSDNDAVEYDVHVVENRTVDSEKCKVSENKIGNSQVSDAANRIKVLFDRASDAGADITKILETGKVQHHGKHKVIAFAKVFGVVSLYPSPVEGSFDVDADTCLKGLSSVLQKLYLLELKLHQEVKAEEKVRLAFERKCKKFKHLEEMGAETLRIDATRILINNLSMKLKFSIQVIEKTSSTINNIRDVDLWPHLNELIDGLTIMWRNMLECHENQCKAISEARYLSSITSNKTPNSSCITATLQLELDLLNWVSSFSSWISELKGFVKSLSDWLLKCIHHEPEETLDGVAPFSPSRLGAPIVFVICNQWAEAMNRISEKEVTESIHVFATWVFSLWENLKLDTTQKLILNSDFVREDQKLQKEISAFDKGIIISAPNFQLDVNNASMQQHLLNIFEALVRLMVDLVTSHEQLIQRFSERNM